MSIPVMPSDFFQFGYVVRSVEGAIRTMRDKMGVTQWQVNELPPGAPGRALAFAYVNDKMIELVDVWPDADSIYNDLIPDNDDELRLHHLGYMIEDEADWRVRIAQFEHAGFTPALVGGNSGMEWYYSDTRAVLGHYTELIRFKSEAGRAFWANVPNN